MKARYTFLLDLISAALFCAIPFSADAQGYRYINPVTSRDSGLTCVGRALIDEQNLDREPDEGAITKKGMPPGNFIEVFCPITRRNVTPYARQVDSPEKVLITNLTVFVRALSYSRPISCRAYALRASTGEVLETAPKYACTSAGGCVQSPSQPRVGWTSLTFDTPFGTDQNNGIVNIGYRCQLPDNRSGIIGSETLFQAPLP